MKKFKFLFLAVLIAVMSIGCAQPTDDDTPIISDAQPTVVSVTVTKLYGSNFESLVSGTEIKNNSDNEYYTILNNSTPIGKYDKIFFPDEIELEYSNGEKRIVSIKPLFSYVSEEFKFNGLLDMFLNGIEMDNIIFKWDTFYKYK